MAAPRTGEITGREETGELLSSAPSQDSPIPSPGRAWRIQRWAFSTTPPANRGVHFFRIGLRILLIMWAEFSRTHLAIRASALTYAILLSLIPILALSTSILKGLGSDEQLKQAAFRFIDQLEAPAPTPRTDPATSPDTRQSQPAASDLLDARLPPGGTTTAHLHRAVDIIFQYVDRTNFAALGVFGVLGLIVVILLVLASIEEAMNVIWHTRKGRPLLRKIMDYMALIILLPLSLNVALAAEAILASKQIMANLAVLLPSPWILTICIKLAPFVCIALTLTTMYLFFPHVKVKTSAALAGAVFASIFWFIFQKLYIMLQVGVANYNAIYGSFASIPLLLVWLQIGWTFILLGASLAYAIQHHRHYHFSGTALCPQHQLQIALDVLRIVYDRFEQRLPTTLHLLCELLPQIRCGDIEIMAARLVKERLLHWSRSRDADLLVPVTTANQLPASEVVRVILGGTTHSSTCGRLAAQAIDAAATALDTSFLTPTSPATDHETTLAPDHPSDSRQQ